MNTPSGTQNHPTMYKFAPRVLANWVRRLAWTLHKSWINYKNRVSWPDPPGKRPSDAHPAQRGWARIPSLRHAVSQPDLAESPNPVGRRDTGSRPTHRGIGAPCHGTQRRLQLRPLSSSAQSGGVVAPPGGTHPVGTADLLLGSRRWSVDLRHTSLLPITKPWNGAAVL